MAKARFARLLLVLFLATVVSPLFSLVSPAKAYVVASGSMEPGIPVGAIVVATPGDVSIGDVVVYHSRIGSDQVHRVVGMEDTEAGLRWVMRGDANEAADTYLVAPEEVVGIVERDLPLLGYLWLIPSGVQIATFLSCLTAYLVITWWESRAAMPVPTRAVAVGLVALMWLPAVNAQVTATWPGSSPAGDVLESTPLAMTAGPMGSTTVSSEGNRATVETGAPKVWKELVLWGCQTGDLTETGCTLDTASTSYVLATGSIVRIGSGEYPGATFFLEAYMRSSTASSSVSVILRNKSDTTDITASEISLTSTTHTLVRSNGFSLTVDKEYDFKYKASDTTAEEILSVKLIVMQQYQADTRTYLLASGADTVRGTTFEDSDRTAYFRYDGSAFDGTVTVRFEAVAAVQGDVIKPTGTIRLYDVTAGAEVTDSTLSLASTDTAPTRKVTGDIKANLVDGNTYKVQMHITGGLGDPVMLLHTARLSIDQDGFSKTARYVHLGVHNTTTATALATEGYRGRYHMDSEMGTRSGYFEATLRNAGSGHDAVADLYDAAGAAAVSGTTLTSSGDAWGRYRSASATLPATNTTFIPRLRATSGTAEMMHAWIVVTQAAGKLYDHTLSTTTASPSCTWDFTLQYVSGTGLARLDDAQLRLRGDSATETQVRVESGSVTVTEGTAVSVVAGNDVEHLVLTDPASSGTSELNVRLAGKCQGSGIHTWQTLVFRLL